MTCGILSLLCRSALFFLLANACFAGAAPLAPFPPLHPTVAVEESVYSYEPADNGAGPLWCSGSTCLVRIGRDVFASGLETIKDCPPLNNCRWTLFHRGANGWELKQTDPIDRTREPCPLAGFPSGDLFLSANPTLRTNKEPGGGPAQPQILRFSVADPALPQRRILPVWEANPQFTEHSYRSFAADGPNREMILFQNIGYTHAEWTFLDREGRWSAHGQLKWPWGAEYDKPEPIRVCYPTVGLQNRAVYFCGVSDVVEPYQKWRDYKKQITGREWDYDFRRLFFTWSDDITTGKYHDWIEIASRDKTCGWISPRDLWAAPDGAVHILWSERAIDERLREKFFPQAKQSQSLNYAVLREGKVILQRSLLKVDEGEAGEIPSAARFQVTPENRLIVFYFVEGKDAAGQPVAENRVLEILPDGSTSNPVRVPLKAPFSGFFTATTRAGSLPSDYVEVLGSPAANSRTMSYARIKLW